MTVLRTLAAIRVIQRICGGCARVQLVRVAPSEPTVCKYCGCTIPGQEPAFTAYPRTRQTTNP